MISDTPTGISNPSLSASKKEAKSLINSTKAWNKFRLLCFGQTFQLFPFLANSISFRNRIFSNFKSLSASIFLALINAALALRARKYLKTAQVIVAMQPQTAKYGEKSFMGRNILSINIYRIHLNNPMLLIKSSLNKV